MYSYTKNEKKHFLNVEFSKKVTKDIKEISCDKF